ncbi:hypothetical protein NE237_020732 [Protea cynaroides]|uniref:H15 domain-containing protein n=1 Tax=Protea cynaroides TaxID=273540 RepID=A0A9Q0HB48_9MAGN|nr:hypothetical protein NE237_020732 [Protea cynaroides]
MEKSTVVPPASTGASPAPEIMNPSIAPRPPPPTTEAEASLPSCLDLSSVPLTTTQDPTVLANAAPPTHSSTPHHPPYAEMITTAIRVLDDKKGSSRTAIKKYIDSTYSNLPASHSALFSHHLKKLKNSGSVTMVKQSYKLPKSAQAKSASVASTSLVPGQRGRGRPPKAKPLDPGPAFPLPKRSPGRPPKSKTASVTVTVTDGQVLQKRGRGRPPRSNPILVPGSNGFVPPPKPRRQPKKLKTITVTPSYGLVAPKQPRKLPKVRPYVAAPSGERRVSELPKSRGRPRKNAAPSTSGNVAVPIVVNKGGGSRPRGRPPKVPKNVAGVAAVVVTPSVPGGDAAIGGVNVVLNNVVSPEKRGRGRPRKTQEGVQEEVRTPKKSVGRPRKTTMISSSPAAAAAMV